MLDLIVRDSLRRLKSKAGRGEYPKLVELLDSYAELAPSPTQWLPHDLYVALDPPQRQRKPPSAFHDIILTT